MKNVVIAIDSFKGCLSSLEAGLAIKRGIEEFCNEIVVIPIADGGEGSIEAIKDVFNAKILSIDTFDPLFRPIKTTYACNKNLAIIEMANSCGLSLLKESEKNPSKTTTYGLGIMIKDAIKKGIRNFIVGIGGSATNDCGSGMLEALGFEFFDSNSKQLKMCGENLSKVCFISSKNSLKELKECKFKIACDVINPLYGSNGAAYVYARQKGADDEMIRFLDLSLKNFADVTYKFNGSNFANLQGAGAAGGVGFGFVSFLNAKLISGFDIISKSVNLQDHIKKSDLIITGEGRLDFQSNMGKTPIKVANIAKKYSKKVIAFGGSVSPDVKNLNDAIDAYFCIQQGPISLQEAMKKEVACKNLTNTANQVIRLLV